MAGGKETPRQKMIGMMYLVLTALLALNVSSETLEKFVFLNESLERQVSESIAKNDRVVANIAATVEELGGREQDIEVLDKANKIREATNEIIKYTNEVKVEMVEITGGYNEDGELIGAQDMDKVANYMINKKNGETLKARLNEYATFLSQELDEDFAPLAYDGKNHPVYKDDKEQKQKDFATLTFESTPTAACMASVSQLQTEVMAYENKALEDLAKKIGAGDVKFDVITPMVRPKSNIIAAGTKYEADLFIAASASGMTPKMAVNGSNIPVVGGMGKVEFTATGGGSYDADGLSKKTYEAAITIDMPGGRDSTFTQSIEYFVAKPVIQIQSASVQSLYLNCGNELQVNVPALGSAYNPSFSAQGGTAIPGSKKGLVTILPKAAEVTLNVSSSGTFIGAEKFSVKRIPIPSIVAKSGGRPIDLKSGVSAPGPRSLTLEAIPDESFAQFLPKDANYRVAEFTIFLGRGARPVTQITSTSPTINLNQIASSARPGDRIIIEVKRVERMNFKKEIEEVRMPTEVITIPLN
ncbi:MAG: gliding motility protein GldM [Candidatus Cyclobacteriaceae bacterium M3_2C_046]